MIKKRDIRNLTLKEVVAFCTENKLPKFRAKQIWEWLWKKRANSFEEITLVMPFNVLICRLSLLSKNKTF